MKKFRWETSLSCRILAVVATIAVTLPVSAEDSESSELSKELHSPIRLNADGKPIDIGELSSIAHAGPCVADVDGDGDRDLLVGDFPGFFWLFENIGDDKSPAYTSKGKLNAGSTAAKTPVY